MDKLNIAPDMPASISIIKHVGTWMRDNNIADYSKWWDPEKINSAMLGAYAKADEFFVLRVDSKPAATAIIQAKQSLQDWSGIDNGRKLSKATYIHYVAVEREFAGQGLVAHLIAKAIEVAQQQNSSVLRLDTNAHEPKLCMLYEDLGFQRVGTQQEAEHMTAFYEKPVYS